MAATRSRRETAGNRMGRLVQDETEEEFYKTAFGGFEEEPNDQEYDSSDSDEDSVDSDFDNPENEFAEPTSDNEEAEKRPKKKFAGAYSLKKKPARPPPVERKQKELPRKTKRFRRSSDSFGDDGENARLRKSTRSSVIENSASLKVKLEVEEVRRKMRIPKRKVFSVKMTQEEMLQQAEITEEENLASLNVYIQLEEEKRRLKSVKKPQIHGPFIRYQSVSMPMSDDHDFLVVSGRPPSVHTRNFVTFSDEAAYPEKLFSQGNVKEVGKQYCVVTGLPAKYRDPVTGMPYANAEAFRIIRQYHSRGSLTTLVDKNRLRSMASAAKHYNPNTATSV
eukprot:m.5670 g.5670  ORF g.5670 m.5670 type:complete len:336 (+) comp13762_c0_seq1:187-1194(+)